MYFKSKNESIYFEKYGNGKDIILILPGWGDTRKTFNNIIYALKDKYTIYIFDYPGFGKSKLLSFEFTIYDYSEIILDFINHYKIVNPTIIAHSFGGRISSILIGKYNVSVKKLILIDVAGIKRRKSMYVFLKEKIYKLLKKIVFFLPKKKRNKYINYLIEIFGSTDYKTISDNMRKTFQNIVNEDLSIYYKKIDVDTLILWGEKDMDTPLKDGYLINKFIDKSALIVYKGATHFSYLDYPVLTNNIIIEFLK